MLKCVSPYAGTHKFRPVAYQPGDVIDDAELEAHLLKDSPVSFTAESESLSTEVKTIDAAPADKMVRTAAKKGGKA